MTSPHTDSTALRGEVESVAGHTPGPWKATFADGGEDWIIHAAGTPWQLAYLRNDKRADWPLKANARLIAAAPDLLSALAPFALVAEHDIGSDETDADKYQPLGYNRAPHITVGHLRVALAAIAKATGA